MSEAQIERVDEKEVDSGIDHIKRAPRDYQSNHVQSWLAEHHPIFCGAFIRQEQKRDAAAIERWEGDEVEGEQEQVQ